jgi:hypothetical protein
MELAGSEALLVLGMHRGGTSSIAGAMVRLGGAAPLNLLPPADDNPKGFWESSVLMSLNDQILEAGGNHWEDWRQFDPAYRRGRRVRAEGPGKIGSGRGVRPRQTCGHQGPPDVPPYALLVFGVSGSELVRSAGFATEVAA